MEVFECDRTATAGTAGTSSKEAKPRPELPRPELQAATGVMTSYAALRAMGSGAKPFKFRPLDFGPR
jgi:hypothetical protein